MDLSPIMTKLLSILCYYVNTQVSTGKFDVILFQFLALIFLTLWPFSKLCLQNGRVKIVQNDRRSFFQVNHWLQKYILTWLMKDFVFVSPMWKKTSQLSIGAIIYFNEVSVINFAFENNLIFFRNKKFVKNRNLFMVPIVFFSIDFCSWE